MNKIKAVFSDLDGTLLNTIGDLANSMNRVLDKMDLPGYGFDDYKLMVGSGVRNMVDKAVSGRGLVLSDEHIRDFVDDYRENCVVDTVPYQGIPELLADLKERNIPVGVITNKDETLAWKITSTIFGENGFAFFRGGREGVPLKPDPAGPMEEAGKLGLKPEEILFLGDSNIDMITGVNCGMFPCGVSWGFRTVKELESGGAKKIISHPVDLLGMLV